MKKYCSTNGQNRTLATLLFYAFNIALLTACGGGGNGGSAGPSSFTVSAAAGAGGNISPTSATVIQGATASFVVTPDGGFSIDSVSGCGGALTGTTYTTSAITADCAVNASFISPPPAVATLDVDIDSVKVFRFSWTDVRTATFYRLLENPDSGSGFTQVGADIDPGVQTVDHIVPLYARLNAQYILQSCNAAGCAESASASVSGSLVAAIGYVKASNTEVDDLFGNAVSLSADGNTLAVGADGEDSNATIIEGPVGSEGNQSDNSAPVSGAVYVFSRNGGTWSQQAYVKASNTETLDVFGDAVSLSGDGNTLAVGARLEDSNAGGIDGNQSDNTAENAGAVYVFSRSGSTWSRQAYIKASNTGAGDLFGSSVSLSMDGNTLAVGAHLEDSNAAGIDGNQSDNTADSAGAVYVFSRSGSTWSQQAYVKASNPEVNDAFGIAVSLSAEGNTLAVGAVGEDSNAAGIDGNQSDNSADRAGAIYVFSNNGGTWAQQAYVKASNTEAGDQFGSSVSLSAEGSTLAVGAREDSNAVGIDGNQGDNTAPGAGAVYVFSRTGSTWLQQAYVKAGNSEASDLFGFSVSLSADGNTLAVGAFLEDGNAVGINGNQGDNTADGAGAAYVFIRDGGTWFQQAYVKASNTEAGNVFGEALSLSGDGNTLAVGANGEDSNATGINGDASDNTADSAGAVYLY